MGDQGSEGELFLGVLVQIRLHLTQTLEDRVVILADVALHIGGLRCLKTKR